MSVIRRATSGEVRPCPAANGGDTLKLSYELWRLIAVKDERRSTWELVGQFPNARAARRKIHELAGPNIVSPEEDLYWYEDAAGTHTFRIEAARAPEGG